METLKTFLDRDTCVPALPPNGGERRDFRVACSATLLTAVAASPLTTSTNRTVKRYQASILSDERVQAPRVSALRPLTSYLFHYPFVATPCLLIGRGCDVGGVWKQKLIVVFSATCPARGLGVSKLMLCFAPPPARGRGSG